MTKKDFELIASALYASMPSEDGDSREGNAAYEQWQRTVAEFIVVLPATNGSFQASKFERYARTGKY